MSDLTDFLKGGVDFLKTVSDAANEIALWSGQSLPCVYNQEATGDALGIGGFAADGTRCTILVKTSDFEDSARPKRGDQVTLRGGNWKVEMTPVDGDAAVLISLVDASRREIR